MIGTMATGFETSDWIGLFHLGERHALAECYEAHFDGVSAAVGRYLQGADRETVVHEVFFALVSDPELRRNFQGGSMGAWLRTIARHRAIDFCRRHRRECSLDDDLAPQAWLEQHATPSFETGVVAHVLIERFSRDYLPAKWQPVFQRRFLLRESQREAARALGIRRTTLAYQELRIRRLLRRFLLGRS